MYMGLKEDAQPGTPRMADAATPSSVEQIAMAAAMAGMPAFDGKPNDPVFDLIPEAPTL